MYFARLALAAFYFCSGLLSNAAEYRQALPGRHFQFPRDHFDHPDFRTEWWYYTGNLRARDGRRYGFELVFFRQGQGESQSQGMDRGPDANPSAWRVRDLYLAHLALTDIDGRRFRYYKRLNRAGPGIAGASFDQSRVWNGNWEARFDASDAQTLSAVADDIRFTLRLTPRKPPVIHGENGVSQKSPGPARRPTTSPSRAWRWRARSTVSPSPVRPGWTTNGSLTSLKPGSGVGTGSACNSTRAQS